MKQALLVIDVQNEYFTGRMPVAFPSGSLENILKAMDAAIENEIPVIVVQHTSPQPDSSVFIKGTDGWKLHPEVERRLNSMVIEKHLPGSFTGTDLDAWLKSRDIDTVVIAGYMTHMCCDTTARQAMHLGYAVRFLSDATGTLSINNDTGAVSAEELHKTVLIVQGARFSKVLTAREWIDGIAAL